MSHYSTAQERQAVKDWRPGAEACNAILRATRYLGRVISTKWSGCHRRCLAETKMRWFKLLGERAMARAFDRQDGRVAGSRRHPESLHASGHSDARGRAVNPPGPGSRHSDYLCNKPLNFPQNLKA